MADASQSGGGEILTLPWNRLPNYLICVVALVNLVTGAVALRIAIGFATGIASFEDAIAAASIGLFGLILIWVAWSFRSGVLPVRFIADAQSRECGFRWQRWWNGRFDLTDAQRLVGELRPYRGRWLWAILVPAGSAGGKDQWIYGTGAKFVGKSDAQQDCEPVLRQLAEHLALPFELRTQGDAAD